MSSGETVIEVKDGKLALKQSAIKWYDLSSTLEALIEFTKFLQSPSTATPLTELPRKHLPMIARLVVESDKTAPVLAKQLKKSIMHKCGVQDDKEAVDDPRLPLAVVTAAITVVAARVNYGVQDSPAALAVWRWEIKKVTSMLPDGATDPSCNATMAQERRQEREQARDAFKTTYSALNDDEKKSLLEKQKKKDKTIVAESTQALAGSSKAAKETTKGSSKPGSKDSSSEDKPTAETAAKSTKAEPPKPKTTKQVQMMNAFFKPARKTAPAAPKQAEASSSESDFQRAFKPFLAKKGTVVAPSNMFISRRTAEKGKGKEKEKAEVIVLDDDGDVEMTTSTVQTPASSPTKPSGDHGDETDVDFAKLTGQQLLHKFLSSVPSAQRLRSLRTTAGSIGGDAPSVRSIFAKLREAEVLGDVKAVGDLQRLLKNRRRLPLKLFQFCDNVRPGYYGTWTKTSQSIRPRAPFKKDHVTFDYSYDSGEEWEEEPEDAEEVISGDDDEESAVDDEEEFDDWLVGDDEVDFEEGANPNASEGERSLSPTTSAEAGVKRKHEVEKKKERETSKKKKVVAPLVPYTSGPNWESRIGECSDHFKPFRIQLINDTPFPIDPFTWVSEPLPVAAPQELTRAMEATSITPAKASTPPASSRPDGFAVPALPPHLHPSSQVNLPSGTAAAATAQKPAKPPTKARANKKPFPTEHLPRLLQEIDGSTMTKLHLIEQLGQIFKSNKEVKKYAIESILGEVASKAGGTWKVKEELRTRLPIA